MTHASHPRRPRERCLSRSGRVLARPCGAEPRREEAGRRTSRRPGSFRTRSSAASSRRSVTRRPRRLRRRRRVEEDAPRRLPRRGGAGLADRPAAPLPDGRRTSSPTGSTPTTPCALQGVLRFNRPPDLKDIAHRLRLGDARSSSAAGSSPSPMSSLAWRRFPDAASLRLVKVRGRRRAAARARARGTRRISRNARGRGAGLREEPALRRLEAPSLRPGRDARHPRLPRATSSARSATVSGDLRLIEAINHFRPRTRQDPRIEVYAASRSTSG